MSVIDSHVERAATLQKRHTDIPLKGTAWEPGYCMRLAQPTSSWLIALLPKIVNGDVEFTREFTRRWNLAKVATLAMLLAILEAEITPSCSIFHNPATSR